MILTPAFDTNFLSGTCSNYQTEEKLREISSLYYSSLPEPYKPQNLLNFIISKTILKGVNSIFIPENTIYREFYAIHPARLSELLEEYVGFTYLANRIISKTIVNLSKRKEAVTLIEVGIGNGNMAAAIARMLKESNPLLEAITIIGIDHSAENLSTARKKMLSASLQTGILIEFIPVLKKPEEVTVADLRDLYDSTNNWPIIYSLNYLHNISGKAEQEDSKRRQFFDTLYKLSPEAVLIADADISGSEEVYEKRLGNYLEYLDALFDHIDSLDINMKEKGALKLYFSDQLDTGNKSSSGSRCHLTGSEWATQLSEAGFYMEPGLFYINNEHQAPETEVASDFISLKNNSVPITSLLCAIPRMI